VTQLPDFHGIRRNIGRYAPGELAALLKRMTPEARQSLNGVGERHLGGAWELWARPEQLLPWDKSWTHVLALAGRGWGKTRVGAEATRQVAESGVTPWIRLAGPTAGDVRDIMVDGPSGILATADPAFKPVWIPSRRELEWPNGVKGKTFSAEEPERFRGGEFGWEWLDEFAAWQYAEAAFDTGIPALRYKSGHWQARGIITTTPKPIAIIKRLLADKSVHVIRGTSYDNLSNLADNFVHSVIERYAGTPMGRQEIMAELVEDVRGAEFTSAQLSAFRLLPSELPARGFFSKVYVAVDPPAETTNECGIVVVGIGPTPARWLGETWARKRKHAYILEDATTAGRAEDWAAQVVAVAKKWNANGVVAEVNNGGDMVRAVIHQHEPNMPVFKVRAAVGKARRAEPVSAAFSAKRVHMVGGFGDLESQMTQYVQGESDWSPDRMDALVWGVTFGLDLTASSSPGTGAAPGGVAKASGWAIS
jgi:phage terminase large subunit-like protein